MRASRLALVLHVLAATSVAVARMSRKELYREILRQLAPKEATGPGLAWYDYEDVLAAPGGAEPSCVAAAVLAEDRRATCRPRKQLVPLPPGPPEVLRFPRLVELKRCEGACDHGGRHCWPTVKHSVNIKVVRVNVTEGKTQAQCAEEIMEEHAKCSCKCHVEKSHCSPNQVYVASECACLCPDFQKLHQCEDLGQTWDPLQCACTCMEGGQDCSTGYYFSKQQCRCMPVEDSNF
ncbi:balbiani ring protein 3 isoform X1 [Dermacentor silvarum]|uniref:balbiani ring protein 3 isoform X1 n=1 Tax=Dermacentor silvarum TaxID=543639 RepID=UPI001899EC51|nr:balbiani ring protein 3 isoform X1 [Dermacentor silvarum]